MPDAVKELGTPPLREVWQGVKTKAEAEAKKVKEGDKYSAMAKKFKIDLGPDLEKWPKLYPAFDKLTAGKGKIDETIKQYGETVKAAGLNANVAKLLTEGLKKIKTEMDARLAKAELLVGSDMGAALKESAKKQIAPLVIFKQDIAAQVIAKSGSAAKILHVDSIALEVILTDPNVLKNVPNDLDDALLAQQIRDKAAFGRVVQDVATALGKAAKTVRRSTKDVEGAKAQFKVDVDKAVADALARAAEPILKLTKVKTAYTSYKVMSGIKLTLTSIGAAAGIVSLALTPLTFGVSTVAGCIGIAKSAVSIGQQIGKLSLKAEELALKVSEDLVTLNKQYENAKKTLVGVGELAKTLVNATLPTMVTTIKECSSDCEQVKSKIDGIDVSAHDTAQKLGALLTEQTKLQKALGEFEKIVKPTFTGEEAKKVQVLMGAVNATAPKVTALITKIGELNTRVKKTTATHKILADGVKQLAAKEPTWAKVGEVVINVAAAAGFGLTNINAPDPYSFATLASTIVSDIGYVESGLETVLAAGEDLKGLLEGLKE
jgi:hypothetical protein